MKTTVTDPAPNTALLQCAPLQVYLGIGRSRIYGLINSGSFPKPIKIGKSSRWVKSEVDAWLNNQIMARDKGGAK